MELQTIKNNVYNADTVLRALQREAHQQAIDTITAVYLRHNARSLVETLTAELAEAEQTAAPLAERIEEAEAAVAKAESAQAGRIAAFWKARQPGSSLNAPGMESPEVQAARSDLEAARAAGESALTEVRLLSSLIDDLKKTPSPDAADLDVLTSALGCRVTE